LNLPVLLGPTGILARLTAYHEFTGRLVHARQLKDVQLHYTRVAFSRKEVFSGIGWS
jgi:hypothetical protein